MNNLKTIIIVGEELKINNTCYYNYFLPTSKIFIGNNSKLQKIYYDLQNKYNNTINNLPEDDFLMNLFNSKSGDMNSAKNLFGNNTNNKPKNNDIFVRIKEHLSYLIDGNVKRYYEQKLEELKNGSLSENDKKNVEKAFKTLCNTIYNRLPPNVDFSSDSKTNEFMKIHRMRLKSLFTQALNSSVGQEKLKNQIIGAFLSAMLKGYFDKSILLYGPPGTGKTTICNAIAKCFSIMHHYNSQITNEELLRIANEEWPMYFHKIALNNVHSANEILGSDAVYKDSHEGLFIKSLYKKKSNQYGKCVLLDEIDKCFDHHGNNLSKHIANIIEPVEDISDNKTTLDIQFNDSNYGDFPFSLRGVFFVATANSKESTVLDAHIKDRFDMIEIPLASYTEKVAGLKKIITNKLLANKLNKYIEFSNEVVEFLVRDDTNPGFRQLSHNIDEIINKIISQNNNLNDKEVFVVNMNNIFNYYTEKLKNINLRKIGQNYLFYNNTDYKIDIKFINQASVNMSHGNILIEHDLLINELEKHQSGRRSISYVFSSLSQLISDGAPSLSGQFASLLSDQKVLISVTDINDNSFAKHIDATCLPSLKTSVFLALISALKNEPINQKIAVIGNIDLQGRFVSFNNEQNEQLSIMKNIKYLADEKFIFANVYNKEEQKKHEVFIKQQTKNQKFEIVYVNNVNELLDAVFPSGKSK